MSANDGPQYVDPFPFFEKPKDYGTVQYGMKEFTRKRLTAYQLKRIVEFNQDEKKAQPARIILEKGGSK